VSTHTEQPAASVPLLAPVVDVSVTKAGATLVRVLCPHCGGTHLHGWAGDGGHRASHCSGASGGYVLADVLHLIERLPGA
jgi:hypothetical protein